jgi:hypothetical protein
MEGLTDYAFRGTPCLARCKDYEHSRSPSR